MAHQSALLMADIMDDDRSMMLLEEIDALKRQLEDQKAVRNYCFLFSYIYINYLFKRLMKYCNNKIKFVKQAAELEIREMQNKLEEHEAEASLELMEEKLKLAEAELECALQRAQRAELESKQLQNQGK